MEKRNIIVIGASAGGFEALKCLAGDLPEDLDASVFIVWHMAPDVRGILPQILNKKQKLFAAHAFDGEVIKAGRIYVAQPDHHLLVEKEWSALRVAQKKTVFALLLILFFALLPSLTDRG